MKRIPGDGPSRPRLFICGERPGIEEYRRGVGFVGPAGQELWARLRDVCGVEREDCYVTNLVKTFSRDPPSPAEVARDSRELRQELVRVRPTVIVTIGYHAARWFLPQFEGINGDHFHGLVFPYRFGTVVDRAAVVIPCVHSSAALRQPTLYQNAFTRDLRMVDRVLHGAGHVHLRVRPSTYQTGLASILAAAGDCTLGLDTEGSIDPPWQSECLTVSATPGEASCIEVWQNKSSIDAAVAHVQVAIDAADNVAIHHAKHDMKVVARLGLRIPWSKVDDTFVMAKLLDIPAALKTLMDREFGWEMSDYDDLVQPLDAALVRSTLEAAYEKWKTPVDSYRELTDHFVKRATARARKEAETADAAGRARRSTHGRSDGRAGDVDARAIRAAVLARRPPPFPPRALTSIQGITTKAGQETLRARWTKSTFAAAVPLPPAPTWKDLPEAVRVGYALTDADAHRAARDLLWRRIVSRKLERVYRVDMGRLPMLTRMEEVGVAVDVEMMETLSTAFKKEFRAVRDRIDDLAGYEINPLSGEQVSQCLFEELGIRPTRETKSRKHFTTADKYLKARRNEHAIVPLILTARQLNKYIGTYTEKLPTLLYDGRYYPSFTQTATGREAEEIILLIPKHDPLAKVENRPNRATAIRNCFHATAGNQLVSVDLSQIELRVMANESRDKRLMEAFRNGEDPHAQVAADLLGAPRKKELQDESAHRLPAKTINFGIINGMTEYGMLDQLHEAGQLQWTLDDVKDLLDEWFRVHSGVQTFWDDQIELAKARGYVADMFGRRRYLAGLHSTDERIVKDTERQCLFAIQSGADGISKVWNAAIWDRIIMSRRRSDYYCEPWGRFHDDTTLEVDTRIHKTTARAMLTLVPQLLDIPTLAEAKVGERWGDLHKIA